MNRQTNNEGFFRNPIVAGVVGSVFSFILIAAISKLQFESLLHMIGLASLQDVKRVEDQIQRFHTQGNQAFVETEKYFFEFQNSGHFAIYQRADYTATNGDPKGTLIAIMPKP